MRDGTDDLKQSEAHKFDAVMRKILAVSKQELQKREKEWHRKRTCSNFAIIALDALGPEVPITYSGCTRFRRYLKLAFPRIPAVKTAGLRRGGHCGHRTAGQPDLCCKSAEGN
jgi:hypothetical protein